MDPHSNSGVITGPKHSTCDGIDKVKPMEPVSVEATATKTIFTMKSAEIQLKVTFQSSAFAKDYVRLSRPVSYINVEGTSLDGHQHTVSVYLDAAGQHVVKDPSQLVEWKSFESQSVTGVRMGKHDQTVLDLQGDVGSNFLLKLIWF